MAFLQTSRSASVLELFQARQNIAHCLAAPKEIRPGVLLAETLPERPEIDARGNKRRFHFRPGQRSGDRGMRLASYRVRAYHGLDCAIAEGVQIHAVTARQDGMLDG